MSKGIWTEERVLGSTHIVDVFELQINVI